jgi:riboflavin kinase/FMN adenylyltransferase
MVQHLCSIQQVSLQDTWLTIGTYDGVHLGHQKIIRDFADGAHTEGAQAVGLTFDPHPAVILQRRSDPHLLTLPDERAEYLGACGIDVVVTHPFDLHVAATTAFDFLTLLKYHIGFRQLWVGFDFALGHHREGDVTRLSQLGSDLGYQLHVVSPITINGETVSSSRIRSMLNEGQVEQAAKWLGRRYCLSGDVVQGDGRGRLIGIPTANLAIVKEKLVPANGVYACVARVGQISYAAAVNIGIRPTFDRSNFQTHVEAHLLDFQGDLYSQRISLAFISRLRGEQRFPNVPALIKQIHQDIQLTREQATISSKD